MQKDQQKDQQRKPYVIVLYGSGDWCDKMVISQALQCMEQRDRKMVLVHGDCVGAAHMGRDIALEMGWTVRCYPAEWHLYGKGAGPRRNQEMIEKERPHAIIALRKDMSRGTTDMIRRAANHLSTATARLKMIRIYDYSYITTERTLPKTD